MTEWIKIDHNSEMPKDEDFLLLDEYGSVHVGSTAFDFYDADYWHPMPKLPMERRITNDDAVAKLLKPQI